MLGRMHPEPIDFYFDFISPYGWFASRQIDTLAALAQAKLPAAPVLDLQQALDDPHPRWGNTPTQSWLNLAMPQRVSPICARAVV